MNGTHGRNFDKQTNSLSETKQVLPKGHNKAKQHKFMMINKTQGFFVIEYMFC